MPFEVPPLPYDYAALEPYIDEQTMHLHHDKHHQAYVDKANGALEGTEYADSSVEQILTILDELPDDIRTVVRNNAGGHANHSFFWEIMGPDGGGEPEGPLADAIDDVFGSLDELKKAVNDGGINRFGSGWTWLVYDGTNLAVYSTPNQDSPIIDGKGAAGANPPRRPRVWLLLAPDHLALDRQVTGRCLSRRQNRADTQLRGQLDPECRRGDLRRRRRRRDGRQRHLLQRHPLGIAEPLEDDVLAHERLGGGG